jgi:uncharacterized protein (TIGR03437 family)
MRASTLILSFTVLCGAVRAQNLITTFAGTDWIFNGDGKPAVSVHFKQPSAITVDLNGNPVVVDGYFGIVARINPDGTLSVLAGNGFNLGDSGDNGPATAAGLSNPVSAAFDRQGNLYIGEPGHIRKVSTTGTITTIAGSRRLGEGFSGDGGPALDAQISTTGGLAIDAAGNIYLADDGNYRVRKIDTTTRIITTVAGNGVEGSSCEGGQATAVSLNSPRGLAVDGSGDLYIADTNNNCIRKVTPGGLITTVVPSSAGDTYPSSLALDNAGALYIGAYYAVYKLLPGATLPQLFAGNSSGRAGFSGDNGPAINALLNGNGVPVATDDRGNLFLADKLNYRVRKIANGVITTIAGVNPFPAEHVSARDVPLVFPQYTPSYNSPSTGLVGGLAFDGLGNVFVSEPDNNRVLKISPDGIIATFAGTGILGYTGDDGPATLATLNAPSGLAFYAGNLYIADSGNGIRRVTPDGIITTYTSSIRPNGLAFDKAGNLFATCAYARVCKVDTNRTVTIVAGTGGYGNSGDGGAAIGATLEFPSGIAVDGKGNIYVADYWNSRVRVVTPDGTIHAYAGTGVTERSAGDNGPAAQAWFGQLNGLALDTSGNLYIADSYNGDAGSVRVVSPSGIIATLAGGGPSDRLGDGMPAAQATLKAPTALAFDSSLNLYVADGGTNRIRQILANRPVLQVALASLSLAAPSGGAPVTGTISVTGTITGLEFGVSINSAGKWLSADLTADSTPRLLTLTADPGGLAPGSYFATVSITPVAATGASSVSISFQVGEAQPPSLRLDQSEISFTLPQAGPPRSSTLLISNGGGQVLSYTATYRIDSGENWLSISPASGSATPGKASTLTVTANPASLSPGVYTGAVAIVTDVGSQSIPVILTVSQNPQAVLLTQTGLSFTAVAQGGVIPPQSFGVVNAGIGVMNWTATTSTTAGGSWLLISPASGSSDAAAASPQVTVSVNTAGLARGAYYGTVRVAAPGTANQSRVVTVFLNVLPAGTPYPASVQPPELVFYAAPGGLPPGSQIVNLYNIAALSRSFTSGRSSDGFALYPLPGNGTLNPSQPTRVVVQPYASFDAGTTKGALTFQFSDGTAESVRITVVSAPAGVTITPSSLVSGPRPKDQTSCVASQLVVKLNTLSQAFQVSAGWPVGLNVRVTDDCQNPLVSGTGSVWAHFDDGEDDVVLTPLGEGTWQGTWKPSKVNPNVTLTLNARQGALSVQRAIVGTLASANDQPLFTLSSIGSAFPVPSPLIRPLAPGSFLSIYGQRLADFAADASGTLLTQLGNTQVFFNDRPGVLSHADPGQINVVVPYGVNVHTSNQIRIQRGLTLSNPVAVDIADAQPSVLQGNGTAILLDYPANGSPAFQVSSAAPAAAGDVLVMYCAGLGIADQPIADGATSPFSPLASVSGVTVSIGGRNAAAKAVLAPGYVGLYQINAVMPAGVAPGSAVLTVTAGGQTSPMVTLAVR